MIRKVLIAVRIKRAPALAGRYAIQQGHASNAWNAERLNGATLEPRIAYLVYVDAVAKAVIGDEDRGSVLRLMIRTVRSHRFQQSIKLAPLRTIAGDTILAFTM